MQENKRFYEVTLGGVPLTGDASIQGLRVRGEELKQRSVQRNLGSLQHLRDRAANLGVVRQLRELLLRRARNLRLRRQVNLGDRRRRMYVERKHGGGLDRLRRQPCLSQLAAQRH